MSPNSSFEPNLDIKPSINVDISTVNITQNGLVTIALTITSLANLLFSLAETMETTKDKATVESLAKQSLGWK